MLLYDADSARSHAVQEESGGVVALDLEHGLAESPDAALICTPTALHLQLAEQALQAGAHLFIEKPISHALSGVDELVAEASARHRVLLVGCNMRFHRPITLMKLWLDGGAIGRPLYGQFRYGSYLPNWRPQQDYRSSYSARSELGGGIVLDAVHEIDYARWFLGEPEMVSAMTGQVSGLDINTEDVAEISLRFASGAMADIHMDYLRPVRGRSCELIGDEGMIVWRAEGKSPERSRLERYEKGGELREELTFSTDLQEMYVEEMRHFLQCVRGEESPTLDGLEAKRVLEISLNAKYAAKSGKAIPV